MLQRPEAPIRRACQRRYPAWTLYARAFAGNRADADDIVRRAVNRTLRTCGDLSSERQAHERVLAAIRSEALDLLQRRQAPPAMGTGDGPAANAPATGTDDGVADNAPPTSPPGRSAAAGDRMAQPSVLKLLTAQASAQDPRYAGDIAAAMLDELPRRQRRAIQMLLLRRPAVPLRDVARRRRQSIGVVSEQIEEGLDLVAASLHANRYGSYEGGHPGLKALTGYVDGALTGDEARRVVAHCADCGLCGDRLGTMMLLRSGAAKAARVRRVPRSVRVAVLVLVLGAGLAGGLSMARMLAPNPWAEQATVETVPRWFHEFLYGFSRNVSARDAGLAQGLDALVRGEYAEAAAKLEPLLGQPGQATEASAYLGIARYLSGDASRRTVELLEAGTRSARAGRIADWYLANALLVRGEVQDARQRLAGLAFIGDWVGRQAQALLQRIDRAARGAVVAG